MLTLYHLPYAEGFGANARKIAILLNELELNWKGEAVSRNAVRTSPEYALLHPDRKVPVLKDGETIVIESAAVLQYLAEVYGSGKYLESKYDALAWVSLQNGLSSAVSSLFQADDESQKTKAINNAKHYLELLDDKLASSKSGYILDSGYSIADIAWIAFIDDRRKEKLHIESWEQFPNIAKWQQKVLARPAVAKAYEN
ncbi:hypothetical protein KL929_002988 [Ogataea haglerorum]|uniref:uncharacterized protein n=1 Tax=Ogataea haglerorum TaxID=1937702 RepID=UPI001C89CC8B|nr:uncharacterized protein KL911_002996 [Ogataea haglerorum]KAG7695735.1 hypothetical protein KL951_003260 [Ogataea haglerorum]KAG7718565.1 hypothetical protein KL913_002560 [Ogataea haglerorum]KAG7718586.1 hypothetical protein KL949_002582 [Ogataea haglerorum]KAG7737294.1 hypothetical protein KL923_003683 [Ogataea haglerorum]KAG7747223.1 hypothetical protein KL912_003247 [Ogataea haglerorum]